MSHTDLALANDQAFQKVQVKQDILFLLHLPPPVHGSSVVGGQIKNSLVINSSFSCRYMNLLASRSLGDSGKFDFGKLMRFVILGASLARNLWIKKPDACYIALTTTGLAFFRDAILIAMLKVCNVKRIYHLHNKGVSRKQINPIYRFTYQFVFNNAYVILLSKHLYQDIQSFVPPDRVTYCPNGVADEFTDNLSALKIVRSTGGSIPNILFLSNLIETKGVNVLLEACALLQDRGIHFICDFIGAEGDISAVGFHETIARLGLVSNVRYLGKKFGKDKEAAYIAADIFVLPTYNECFPLVLIEAMQYSLPVVTCPEGGIPDQVADGKTGFLVPRHDITALAIRLEELILNSEMRKSMSLAARKKYENEFTLNIFEKNFTRVMGEAIAGTA